MLLTTATTLALAEADDPLSLLKVNGPMAPPVGMRSPMQPRKE